MKWVFVTFVARRVRSSLRELLWTHVLTSGTLAITLFVFGTFLLLQENLQHLLAGWAEQIQIQAYLKRGLGQAEVRDVVNRAKAFPEVEQVRFISQEQAWNDFRSALGAQSGLLDGLPADVLPASLEIAIKPGFRDSPRLENLASRLREEKGIEAVDYPHEWVARLSLVILAVRWAKWVLGGILFIATVFVVSSTIRLAILARKGEIEIMQLVGAPQELIHMPFILEGMVQGLMGGLLAVGALWGLFLLVTQRLPTVQVLGPLTQLQFIKTGSIAMILTIGWFLGAAGSVFSLRSFLRKWRG